MDKGLFAVPAATNWTEPKYVPVASVEAFAEIKTALGVVPLRRSTLSQLPPAGVLTEVPTWKPNAAPLLETVTAWETCVALPCCAVNWTPVVLTRIDVCADALPIAPKERTNGINALFTSEAICMFSPQPGVWARGSLNPRAFLWPKASLNR